jgi:hypothetical protein
MAAKKQKNMTINIDPAQVVFTQIMKDRSGYNSARMVVKAADKEYLQISYDWEGAGIPDFAMMLMDFMKSNNVETSGVWPGQEAANAEFAAAKKKEKMCPDCKKPMSECECEDEEEAKKKMTPEEFKKMIEEKKKKKEKK